MPNQLSIPFKKTWEVQVRQAVRAYILKNYTDTHPDAFRWDVNRWETLRREAVGTLVHFDRVKTVVGYHAQLVYILTKLPADIGLEIPYAPAFNPSALPETLSNLVFERAVVLFNLAALYSQLAGSEDRSGPQGLKQAILHYQNAAGALRYLASAVILAFKASVQEDEMPLELTEAFVASLENMMLAQAQECVWQKAVMDNYKNGVIAKLASKVSSLYALSLSRIKDASPSIRHLFPSYWLPHLETKQLHFEAATQYRKSVDDLEANRFGHEIARLTQAQTVAKRGYDIARRGGVAHAVLQDIKSLSDTVQKSLARAERDNDLIYHQDVPSISALPLIQEASMVQSVIHPGLIDPKKIIGNDAVIFGELLGWGARVAIDIYNDRRKNFLKDDVTDRAQQLDDISNRVLQSLNLPAALEALERPIGLPPSLLKKAEEVRLQSGPSRIEENIKNVQKLAHSDIDILNEAMDILDQEAEEDESFQAEHSVERLSSHEANKELIAKAERYRAILDQAAQSDELVRTKWDEWERNIVELTWDETQLEASIPSSVISFGQGPSSVGATPTQTHAHALRVLLESLDDLMRARDDLVRRATRLAELENITPRVLKAAAGIERWIEVQPSTFEDALEEELAKYDKFRIGIEDGEQRQETLLQSIQERNQQFLQSRRDDESVKEREHALQSLDLAYHMYKEIMRNLDEGLKFYNDFASVLTQFRDTCNEWVLMRRNEIHSLTQSFESLLLDSAPPSPSIEPAPPEPPSRPEQQAQSSARRDPRAVFDLPPPDSDEWETTVLPPAPAAPPAQTPARRTRKTRAVG